MVMALKALVLSADNEARAVLSRILAELGVQQRECSAPASACSLLTHERFDAILLEWADDEAIRQFIAEVRAAPRHQRTFIVAFVDGDDQVRKVFAAGANLIIHKPIAPERVRPSLRAARALMRRERRRSQRLPASGNVKISPQNAPPVRGTLVDLNEEGAAIAVTTPLAPSDSITLDFTLPGAAEEIHVQGSVARVFGNNHVGIQFADLPQQAQKLLKIWLQQKMS
jgi:DNA-binding response OmpR family regulator